MDTILDEFLMNAQAQGGVRGAQGSGHRVVGPQPAVRTNAAGESRKVFAMYLSYSSREGRWGYTELAHYHGRCSPFGLTLRCHSLFDTQRAALISCRLA